MTKKLQAVGYQVDDDDLVFYALKGLPKEYKPIRAALNAKGDIMFSDLATILKNEESQILRDESLSAPKVFLTGQTQNVSAISTGPQHQPMGSALPTSVFSGGLLGTAPQFYQVPMFQNPQASGSYFPVQTNRNFNSGQPSRGNRGSNNKMECQICGKTNHTALYSYHRQNLQYQPPSTSTSSQYSRPRNWNGGSSNQGSNQSWNGGSKNQFWNGDNNAATNGSFVSQPQTYQRIPPQSQTYAVVTPQSQPPNVNVSGGYFSSPSSSVYQMQRGSQVMSLPQPPPQAYITTTVPQSQGPQLFVGTTPQVYAGFSANNQGVVKEDTTSKLISESSRHEDVVIK
ncbi:hypothetical protein Vadar_011858 [Vaccinium darrowii]|uniref:Uncharacterized protein n=1 Tax=Vaccinium darrowii TaxID=229202 RepID=A0ACB7X929_9ERIC|nr:hypothetical protein Vadar_011858 [Vaccinium darrowii]